MNAKLKNILLVILLVFINLFLLFGELERVFIKIFMFTFKLLITWGLDLNLTETSGMYIWLVIALIFGLLVYAFNKLYLTFIVKSVPRIIRELAPLIMALVLAIITFLTMHSNLLNNLINV